jgi:LysM repeat protein
MQKSPRIIISFDTSRQRLLRWLLSVTASLALLLSACVPVQPTESYPIAPTDADQIATPIPVDSTPTPFPTRPPYLPGELVDYIAQTGDTLPALAVRFNTTESEIRQANPILPEQVTTMPPGMPMKIPIYYRALWGSQFQIIPDSRFVYGPDDSGFDPVEFVNGQPGWLKNALAYSDSRTIRGGEIIQRIATIYSVSPRLLLALIEYQTGALTQPAPGYADETYPLGFRDHMHQGLFQELILAANTLNNGYYDHRNGKLVQIELSDGQLEIPDPWQNSGTMALHYYFSKVLSPENYYIAIESRGFIQTYQALFGDPWENFQPHIPGSLQQPDMTLPFAPGFSWAYTGGPHTGYGEGEPLAAIDFAPPSVVGGCNDTDEWSTAVADGVIARKETATAVLDLDGDGDPHTGWVVYYLHLATDSIPPAGTVMKTGDPIGLPSCEGGRATGTHVHIARLYNGEWMDAGGIVPFNLDGWLVQNGSSEYAGTLVRFGRIVFACDCSNAESQVQAGSIQQSRQTGD